MKKETVFSPEPVVDLQPWQRAFVEAIERDGAIDLREIAASAARRDDRALQRMIALVGLLNDAIVSGEPRTVYVYGATVESAAREAEACRRAVGDMARAAGVAESLVEICSREA